MAAKPQTMFSAPLIKDGTRSALTGAPVRFTLLGTRSLAIGLIGFLLFDQVLLLALLGFSALVIAAAALLCVGLCAALARTRGWGTGPAVSPKAFAGLFLAAAVLFMLGGEGRVFYANTDWQVRYAVLNDLVSHPWPWAYVTPLGLTMLRCPVAVYLFPALVGKLAGSWAAELAMLVQNAALLAALLALAAPLFAHVKRRWVLLVLMLGFSGLDVLGQVMFHGNPLVHLEQWDGLQYTAMVTLAFWVPQHALAGWIGTVFYLRWRAGGLPLAAFLVLVPALPLLSPLAAFGIIPFAALAGLSVLFARRLMLADVALPAVSVLLAVPSLLYLASGMGGVPTGAAHYDTEHFVLLFLFEVVPFLIVLWLSPAPWAVDRATVLVAIALLFVLPFGRVGDSIDFMMRASIPSLAIVAIVFAEILCAAPARSNPNAQAARRIAICIFVIGLAVPVGETARAVLFPRSPAVLCGYYGVVPGGFSTYIAPLGSMSAAIRPAHPTLSPIREPLPCWNGKWPNAARTDFLHTPR